MGFNYKFSPNSTFPSLTVVIKTIAVVLKKGLTKSVNKPELRYQIFIDMPVITVIGSLNTDMVTRTDRVPNGGETVQAKSFEVGWGGKGANQAVAAARLSRSKETLKSKNDITVRMIGAVGKDVFGPQLKKSMEEDGIDMQGVKVFEGEETGTAVILVEESTGENRILVTPGANFALKVSDELVQNDDYGDVTIFQLESPMDVVSCVNFV
jgi:ribokinase